MPSRAIRTLILRFSVCLSLTTLILLLLIGTNAVSGQDTGVTALTIDITVVRYGPGIDFPRIGSLAAGQTVSVLRRHSTFPWIEIAYPDSASGRGWIYKGTVRISGKLNSLPEVGGRDFGYPTLTATPMIVQTGQPPANGSTVLTSDLGNAIYQTLMQYSFQPGTHREGSAFVIDLRIGQTLAINPNVAYSGASILKIPAMVALYRKLTKPPTLAQAKKLADMMICSENVASNAVVAMSGDGDFPKGAQFVTDTMRALGLNQSFMFREFWLPKTATATLIPPTDQMNTGIDQTSADPDLYNQTTPADMARLMADLYQCAIDGTGPLVTTFPGEITMMECRQMVQVMKDDNFTALIKAGVPEGANIAHKQGWLEDTQGDAAIVMTPGGDYVLSLILHNRDYLDPRNSFPAAAEISRSVYNAYNPDNPLAQIYTGKIPYCQITAQALKNLQASELPPIR